MVRAMIEAARDITPSEAELIGSQRRSSLTGNAALCLAAYIYGSLPLIYLLGRRRRVDLTRTGSGNVGSTNLLSAGGAPIAAAGWIFDASKGLAPVAVGRKLGCSRNVAELAGVCGVVGQCWPIFLGFHGGRGISAYVGAASQMDREAWAVALTPMIAGSLWRIGSRLRHGSGNRVGQARVMRSKSVPFGCFISAVAFAMLAFARRRHEAQQGVAPVLLSSVILLRRLTAPLPDDTTNGPRVRQAALWYRLLYDRNTSE